MEQRAYWDHVAPTKEFTLPLQSELLAQWVTPDSSILDFGCGYGRTLNQLQQLGYQNLCGIDFSPEMIRRGKTLFPTLDLRVKVTEQIDLPDQSVDAILLFAVLTCIHQDKAQSSIVRELYRILKPGGILYINDYLLASDPRNLHRYEKFQDKYGCYGIFELPEGAICRHHSWEYLNSLLSAFHTEHFQSLTFTTMNGHTASGFAYLGQKH